MRKLLILILLIKITISKGNYNLNSLGSDALELFTEGVTPGAYIISKGIEIMSSRMSDYFINKDNGIRDEKLKQIEAKAKIAIKKLENERKKTEDETKKKIKELKNERQIIKNEHEIEILKIEKEFILEKLRIEKQYEIEKLKIEKEKK